MKTAHPKGQGSIVPGDAARPNGGGPAAVPGSPGEVLLRLFMTPLGLTAYRVSIDLGVPPIAISEILRGRRAISPVMAMRLGVYFGVEPHFWLALQSAYDLRLALQQGAGPSEDGRANGVIKCEALEDRQFVIRESKNGTDRNYEVILARVRLAATIRRGGNHGAPARKIDGEVGSRPLAVGKTKKREAATD